MKPKVAHLRHIASKTAFVSFSPGLIPEARVSSRSCQKHVKTHAFCQTGLKKHVKMHTFCDPGPKGGPSRLAKTPKMHRNIRVLSTRMHSMAKNNVFLRVQVSIYRPCA